VKEGISDGRKEGEDVGNSDSAASVKVSLRSEKGPCPDTILSP
jgi:hypothetical protein